MTATIADEIHFLQQPGRNVLRLGDAAIEHGLHDEELAKTHDGLAEYRYVGQPDHETREKRAARDAAALRVIIRIDRDHTGDSRVVARRENERDRGSNRNSRKRDLAQVEAIEKALDRIGEKRSVVFCRRYFRIAMARIVDRINGEAFRKLRRHLLEEIELRSERVQENQRRTFT